MLLPMMVLITTAVAVPVPRWRASVASLVTTVDDMEAEESNNAVAV